MSDDSLIEVIISALPDMETSELADLETAVNAEIQDRYRNEQRPELLCDCDECQILRGGFNV